MRPREMVLLVKLACGHTLVFARSAAPTSGNTVACSKCKSFEPRRVVERSWVPAKSNEVTS